MIQTTKIQIHTGLTTMAMDWRPQHSMTNLWLSNTRDVTIQRLDINYHDVCSTVRV